MSRTSAVETIHFFIHNEYVMSAGPSNVCVCHLFDCLDISVCVYLYRSVYTRRREELPKEARFACLRERA